MVDIVDVTLVRVVFVTVNDVLVNVLVVAVVEDPVYVVVLFVDTVLVVGRVYTKFCPSNESDVEALLPPSASP